MPDKFGIYAIATDIEVVCIFSGRILSGVTTVVCAASEKWSCASDNRAFPDKPDTRWHRPRRREHS